MHSTVEGMGGSTKAAKSDWSDVKSGTMTHSFLGILVIVAIGFIRETVWRFTMLLVYFVPHSHQAIRFQ